MAVSWAWSQENPLVAYQPVAMRWNWMMVMLRGGYRVIRRQEVSGDATIWSA